MSKNQSSLIQLISGMQEIKLNDGERSRRWQWERIQANKFRVNVSSIRLQQWQEGGSLFINEFKNILITFISATAVINGEMTLGMMLAVQYIAGQLNAPVNDFVSFIGRLQDARISLDRIGEIHALKDEEQSFLGQRRGDFSCSGDLVLRNVSFQYEGPQSARALRNINLTIKQGKITAIVGTSGSGKTTFLKLLLKFYSPIEGKMFLGSNDMSTISPRDWRSKCGVVMQDGFIFSDTIINNICVREDELDMERIQYAARVANIHEFIEELPLNYYTRIGPDGTGLSAGQRQRILIARAIYKDPQYLFFDEATSALDANNEKVIMENLGQFYKGRTVIVIAHRLSTVKNADNIIVLNKGELIEDGSHMDLTLRKGAYFELVRNQLELGEN
jgi:ATP-binding cassette subfamily B protein